MGLKARHTKKDIHAVFEAFKKNAARAFVFNLSYLGELCINHARTLNTYRDQTGNLRNSVGYVVLMNGKIVKSNFGKSATVGVPGSKRTTKGGQNGVVTGRAFAKQLAAEYSTGYALIVVAGMNYAVSVEAKGLDVLTSAEQLAKSELPRLLRDLKFDMVAAA